MEITLRILCLLVGYLLGSFLTAECIARLLTGRSARDLGSGNPGMANIMATLGKGPGFAVLAGDVAKTVLACGLCWLLAGPVLGHTALLYAGAGAISGHNCSLWHKGWGGKGVAVTCTWLILYLPVTGALCCLAGGLAVLGLGYLPLGGGAHPHAGNAHRLGAVWARERHHPAVGRGYDVLAAQKWIAQNFFGAGKTIFPPQKLRISYHGRAKKAILRRKTNGETAKNKKIEKIRKKFKKSVDI